MMGALRRVAGRWRDDERVGVGWSGR
jgi:hypothetical protein